MIRGKAKEEVESKLSVEDVLRATNGGYDIFKYYLGNVGKLMSRPWGRKETKLSWGIFSKDGIWFFRDLATGENGNAFHFVERMYSLTFLQAKDKICWDFGLGGKFINASPVIVTWKPPVQKEKSADIRFTYQPFRKRHHEFWNAAEVVESHCTKHNCYAVKDLAINKRRVNIQKDEIVFAYYAEDEDFVKIYFPDREKDKKFKTNASFHYLWNYSKLENCENLIVQKSNKDMIVTTLLEPCCIATQSESVSIFDHSTVEKINTISQRPWIWYGSDWDGVDKCKRITDANKWRYINTPSKLLPEINDVYGFVKKFGLKSLEEFMRTKKLLR